MLRSRPRLWPGCSEMSWAIALLLPLRPAAGTASFEVADFFAYAPSSPEERFDGQSVAACTADPRGSQSVQCPPPTTAAVIFDYTFLCAIEPDQRERWV